MNQADLFRLEGLVYAGQLVDKHPLARGASRAGLFADASGKEYVAKKNTTEHPFLIANEYIAYQLLRKAQVNVPMGGIKEVRNTCFWFSEFFETAQQIKEIGIDRLGSTLNKWQDLLSIVCCDWLILNVDRHSSNVLLVKNRGGHDIYAIDHDRALFNRASDEAGLNQLCALPPEFFVHQTLLSYLSPLVTSFSQFEKSIATCQNIADRDIDGIVDNLKNGLLNSKFKSRIKDVLKDRRDKLKNAVVHLFKVGLFPKTLIVPSL